MLTIPPFNPADFPGDITLDHLIPAAAADFAPLPGDLRPELVTALAGRGIERLYSHQAKAYEAVRKGRHLVVVTPTASGKTLCYNLPVLQRLLEEERFDRVIVPATSNPHSGLSGDDLVWLLESAPAEVVILRPDPADRMRVSAEAVVGHF